jgi:CheY-like chemotaxis protein
LTFLSNSKIIKNELSINNKTERPVIIIQLLLNTGGRVKISEFKSLAVKAANKTSNVRLSKKSWENSGVHNIPDKIAEKIDCFVPFIQKQINNGLFCKKNEYLLLYNFQLLQPKKPYFCSIDIVIKPLSKIAEIDTVEGQTLQLVINGDTGEVMNNIKGMMEMRKIHQLIFSPIQAGRHSAKTYGNYLIEEKLKIIHGELAGKPIKAEEGQKSPLLLFQRNTASVSIRSPNSLSSRMVACSPSQKSLINKPKVQILIVEDNTINQKMLTSLLKKQGYTCIVANNGKEAVQIFKENVVNIILMDIEMPVMNGLEATKAIREAEKNLSASNQNDVTIIGISGHDYKEKTSTSLEIGMDDYLPKPYNREELLERIAYYMQKYPQNISSPKIPSLKL